MRISTINNHSSQNFNGKIITKGAWTKELKTSFLENEEIKKLHPADMILLVICQRKEQKIPE